MLTNVVKTALIYSVVTIYLGLRPRIIFYITYEEEFLAHSYNHINTRLIDGLVDLSKLIVLIKADRRCLHTTTTACLLESVCLAKSNPTIATIVDINC